ncbi:aminopeptidase P family protein [Aquincola sp. S2]|uniref:Aminopeptidase P family protein n=1 Tax=Pseudaquabacterium terrae TaxID=2732868 RepID=A0ABX2EE68_9BURK|nr:M24 family metallopeptidase [Aquabacterium terrae]NRF66914.1 aminopeptidase P family protein [Aquabacterium terrae]
MPIGYQVQPSGWLDRGYRAASRWLSRLPSRADALAPPEALAGFRRAQRIAYHCVTTVAAQLHEGMREVEAAELLAQHLEDQGVTRYLHRPFAWFGEHARFDGYQRYADYHPSERRLAAGDCAILDVSPMVDGYIGDVGYACALGPHDELARAMDFLRGLRARIPALFMSGLKSDAIWAEVDRQISAAGFDNVHAKYPFCVLGHRVYRVKPRQGTPLRIGRGSYLGWFSLQANWAFLRHGGASQVLSPEHQGRQLGLWAIEPHIGFAGGGAKFEEILVVEPNRAYWLDDSVPHVAAPTW